VAGAAALLHEYGDYQVANVGGDHWEFDRAKRHEVMKAVLLNSADKLAGVHGSKRTVESNVEGGNYIWTDTAAFDSPTVSLDPQLGAGHLNAKRALTQYSGGEWGVGSTVPAIGWDFHETGGIGTTLRYTLPENLGGYFAITLAWDRQVTKIGPLENTYVPGDFFTTGFNDLDLFLLPVGWTSFAQAVDLSFTADDNVEHIFGDVPVGNYEIVVDHFGGAGTDQAYGLAWWHGDPYVPGDFDGDGDVDGDDLSQWEEDYGMNGGSDADGDGDSDGDDFLVWQRNFGAGAVSSSTTAVPEPGAGLLAMVGLVPATRPRAQRK
jgi:hypothetical protein